VTATVRHRSWLADYVDDAKHGPLPALLLLLTVATGLVDAVSILSLGRVFVANMTGNVVFIGFALAGAPGFSLEASLVALAGFLLGASLGGVAVQRFAGHRGLLLRNVTAVQVLLLLAAAVLTAVDGAPLADWARDVAVALLAVALGMQNAAVRRLAVPDLTTTVLTMTLTGVAADVRSGNTRVAARRVLSVLAMLAGAVVGAVLVLHVSIASALFSAAGLVAVTLIGAALASRRTAPWATASGR
jgi:uncharacterized membrane protein YoaK (UPF0700 family)